MGGSNASASIMKRDCTPDSGPLEPGISWQLGSPAGRKIGTGGRCAGLIRPCLDAHGTAHHVLAADGNHREGSSGHGSTVPRLHGSRSILPANPGGWDRASTIIGGAAACDKLRRSTRQVAVRDFGGSVDLESAFRRYSNDLLLTRTVFVEPKK